jgi:hypothetical protein
MYLNKEEREELSSLSKEVFGTRSQWQKILDKGHSELVTRKIIETVKGEDGQDKQEEKTMADLNSAGKRHFYTKYHTVESLKEWMLSLKTQRDEIIAMMNKQNEERKAKAEEEERAKKFQEDNGGSAL